MEYQWRSMGGGGTSARRKVRHGSYSPITKNSLLLHFLNFQDRKSDLANDEY